MALEKKASFSSTQQLMIINNSFWFAFFLSVNIPLPVLIKRAEDVYDTKRHFFICTCAVIMWIYCQFLVVMNFFTILVVITY